MLAEIKLITCLSSDEIAELHNFLSEKNEKGILVKLSEKEPEPGTMAVGDYLPVIQLILGSTAVAAGIKGFFDIIKNYFSLQEKKILAKVDLEKAKLEQHKIEFEFETKDGKKERLRFSSFDENERKQFFGMIDNMLK